VGRRAISRDLIFRASSADRIHPVTAEITGTARLPRPLPSSALYPAYRLRPHRRSRLRPYRRTGAADGLPTSHNHRPRCWPIRRAHTPPRHLHQFATCSPFAVCWRCRGDTPPTRFRSASSTLRPGGQRFATGDPRPRFPCGIRKLAMGIRNLRSRRSRLAAVPALRRDRLVVGCLGDTPLAWRSTRIEGLGARPLREARLYAPFYTFMRLPPTPPNRIPARRRAGRVRRSSLDLLGIVGGSVRKSSPRSRRRYRSAPYSGLCSGVKGSLSKHLMSAGDRDIYRPRSVWLPPSRADAAAG